MSHVATICLNMKSAFLSRHTLLFLLLWLCASPVVADETTELWQRVQHARECYVKGYADSAMFQARELLPKIMSNGSMIMLAMDYIIIGAVYSERDDKQSALKEYGNVARIAETYDFLKQARNPKLSFLYQTMIPVYAQLTMLCEDLGQYEQSLTYARTGTQWLEQNGDPKQYGTSASVFTEALGNNEYGKEGRANDAGNEEMTAMRQEVPVSPGTVRSNANDSATAVGNADSRVGTGARTIVKYVHLPNDRREWAVTVLVIVIVSFLCYVLWQRRMRRKMERETEKQMDERYIEGQEDERTRLARELHDGISNQLLAVEMKLNEDGTSPQTLQLLGESREMVRRVSHHLMPPEFEHITIEKALASYATQLSELSQCEICFAATPADADWTTIEPRVALEVYRIVQEAVANAMKHGKASLVSIGIHSTSANSFTVTISDNGENNEIGGDVSHVATICGKQGAKNPTSTKETSGIGHRTMNQRAALIGGRIEVFRHPYGTTLRLSVGH